MTKLYAIRCNPKATGITTNWYDEATPAEIDAAAGVAELREHVSKVQVRLTEALVEREQLDKIWADKVVELRLTAHRRQTLIDTQQEVIIEQREKLAAITEQHNTLKAQLRVALEAVNNA
jgi:hypothetical protein